MLTLKTQPLTESELLKHMAAASNTPAKKAAMKMLTSVDYDKLAGKLLSFPGPVRENYGLETRNAVRSIRGTIPIEDHL